MKIDHVTFATADLDTLRNAFAHAGLATDYGGAHSNGITHMASIGFDDGSYIELISTLKRGQPAPWWDRFIAADAGPCGWAVGAGDVVAETERVAALGISVDGPHTMSRQRPDGKKIEWELAFLGGEIGYPGGVLPFIIKNHTPHDWRVMPSASVAGSELTGISHVVIGVRDLVTAARLFQAAYGWGKVQVAEDKQVFGANLIAFDGTPVILAMPQDAESELGARVALLGEAPIACLIETKDINATVKRVPLGQPIQWFGKAIRWIAGVHPSLLKLGVVVR